MRQLSKDNKLDFGKYKGQSIFEVTKKDVGYVHWLLREKILILTETQLLEVKRNIPPTKSFNSVKSSYYGGYLDDMESHGGHHNWMF